MMAKQVLVLQSFIGRFSIMLKKWKEDIEQLFTCHHISYSESLSLSLSLPLNYRSSYADISATQHQKYINNYILSACRHQVKQEALPQSYD